MTQICPSTGPPSINPCKLIFSSHHQKQHGKNKRKRRRKKRGKKRNKPSHFTDSIRHKDFYRRRNGDAGQRENRIVVGFRLSMLSIPATRSRVTGRERVRKGKGRKKRNATRCCVWEGFFAGRESRTRGCPLGDTFNRLAANAFKMARPRPQASLIDRSRLAS